MREPIVFLGPNGAWDLSIFGTIEEARSSAEPVDVLAGEYGERGWDADGRPVALVRTSGKPGGLIGKLLGLQAPEVDVRELEMPAAPESLRKALLGRLAGLEPELLPAAKDMALDELIGVVRESTTSRVAQVSRQVRPWRRRAE